MTIRNVTFPTDLILRRKREDTAGFNFYIERKYWIFYDRAYRGFPSATYRYAVPKDYGTDLASVPSLFRNLASKVDAVEASVIHDHAYEFKTLPRDVADELFRAIMAASGKSWFKRNLMWFGVRIGGWAVWNRRARDPVVETVPQTQ